MCKCGFGLIWHVSELIVEQDVCELRGDVNGFLVWLFAINRTTIPRIYSCSELVCAIVDLGIVGLSVMWLTVFNVFKCKLTKKSFKFLQSAKYMAAILDFKIWYCAIPMTSQVTCNINSISENIN